MKLLAKLLIIIAFLLIYQPAMAYHPLNTEDPGTTEFRHFEMEFGNDVIWPDDSVEEVNGYLAVKSGLAPGLEFDAVATFVYWLDLGEDDYTSGWGDTEMLLKYRLLGDGDGPFNLGVVAGAVFPSGMSRIGQGGEYITPWTLLFGSVGVSRVRFLMDVGVNFVPEEDDTMIWGGALEVAAGDYLVLAAEAAGESDLIEGDGNDPATAGLGVILSAADWLTLSLGAHWGIAPDSDNFYLTFATLVGW